jgi:RecB family exonuclease
MADELRLSVSKTKTFNQCKKQFEFNYVLKMPKKTRDYHVLGSFCHQVLENFHKEYIAGCLLPYHISMTDAFKAAWSQYKDKMTPEMKAESWDIISGYLKSITGKKMDVLAVEKRFEINIGNNVVLNGAIDKIEFSDYSDSGEKILHVSDFKTTKNKKYLKDDWTQLLTYAYVMSIEDPTITKVRASYILLRHNSELITKEFSLEDIKPIKEKYLQYAEQIRSETEYAPNPTILCGWCDYLDSCQIGQKQARVFSGETTWE